jgi:teichoic acid transport system permease protein
MTQVAGSNGSGASGARRVSVRGLSNVGESLHFGEYVKEIWRRREFVYEIPRNEVRAQHMNTLLGNVWHVLNPLLTMAVYWFTFAVILHANRGIPHYLAFLGVGIFTFNFTQRSIMAGSGSIGGNQGLLRSIYFPRAILPVSTIIGQTLTYLPDILVMLVVVLLNGAGLRWTWIFLPVIVFVQMLFNLGASFVAAPAAYSVRDFRNILPYLFRILLYLSGAMFSIQQRFSNNPRLLHLFQINPAYDFIEITRGVVLGTPTALGMYVWIAIWTFAFMVPGFVYFRAREHTYGRQ